VNPLATLLDEFINQYMRNNNIFLTVAHQSLFQIDEQLRNTLLSLGNYVIGRAATMTEARILADTLFPTNPYHVKHIRNVWASNQQPRTRETMHFVIDHEPEFMRLEEQQELYAQQIKQLRLFEFLLRPAEREGQVSQPVIPITIANFVRDKATGEYLFPEREVVAQLRPLLVAKSGIPIATIWKEQEARLGQGFLQEPRNARALPAPDGKEQPINRRELLS
jgi:hypothetical protein